MKEVEITKTRKTVLRVLGIVFPWLEELTEEVRYLRIHAMQDELTGLLRVPAARTLFSHEFHPVATKKGARRDDRDGASGEIQKEFAAMFIDVDHFKSINDTYGHAVGDLVLELIAEHMRHSFRAEDILFRKGGEELAVIMPKASPTDAREKAERFQDALRSDRRLLEVLKGRPVTATIGIARINMQKHVDPNEAFDDAMERADAAMYEGKRDGRDRIVIAKG